MRLKAVFVAVVLLFGLAHASLAQEKQEFTVKTVSGQSARVHAKADLASPQIASIASGRTVLVVSVEGPWVQVRVPATGGKSEVVGYVSKTLGQLKTVSSSAKPVESDPVQSRAAVAPPNPVPSARAEAPVQTAQAKPASPVSSTPASELGQLGVGATIGYGIVPLVTYDFSKTNSVIASVMPSANVLAFSAGVIHRFVQPDKTDSAKTSFFEPFVGGGVGFVSVTGLSAIGFYGTGGTFFTVKSHPNIRYVAIVNLIPYSGNLAIGATVGAVYVFNK